MTNQNYMTIDGIPVAIDGEKNVLEVIRKAGIKLPTFCYHSELSVYGACRMCMVEDEKGRLDAACSAQPWPGMSIRTNTERLRRYRKMILELILANHCRDCTTCQANKDCKLQELASRFHIEDVRFPNFAEKPDKDASSPCIVKDNNKCILCGDCVRMCNEIQKVGAIDFAYRGSEMTVSTAFNAPLSETVCVGCGQCAAVCPTGAIVVKNSNSGLYRDLSASDVKVTAQIAPAVRVAIGREFGLKGDVFGRIVAAMHRMGFDEVFDTATGADLTVLEEASELLKRFEAGGSELPLFTSCCPAWVSFCEKNYPQLLQNVSTCKSPMQMFAAIIKEHNAVSSSRRTVHVAVMPCSAKKFEAAREEFSQNGAPYVDYVVTTQELITMIRETGIVFDELEAEAADMPFSAATGAGVIFGVTGGVTEAVLRRISTDKSTAGLCTIAMHGVRGMDGVKETIVKYGEREIRIAVVSGLGNAASLIETILAGKSHYDFVEVMACPGGCVSGAGQPYVPSVEKAIRGNHLYAADKLTSVKRSEENTLLLSLYSGVLKGRVHELLHVKYNAREE